MTTREERAAGRRQRRQQAGSAEQQEQAEQPSEARQAARDAATRALAAATVSAVRALAARAGEETSEVDSPETSEVPEVETEPEPEAAEREVRPRMQAHERPRRGADAATVQDAVAAARDRLRELHGSDAESVSGLERTPNGWAVDLEVVEVRRIPESTDVLATYRVELDESLDLLNYERTGRYHRAQADDRSSS